MNKGIQERWVFRRWQCGVETVTEFAERQAGDLNLNAVLYSCFPAIPTDHANIYRCEVGVSRTSSRLTPQNNGQKYDIILNHRLWILTISIVYKPGKVCIVLQGRQAGKKVVVVKPIDNGDKERKYPYAVVAGVDRYPRKVNKRMGSKLVEKRSKVKPFIKVRPITYTLLSECLMSFVDFLDCQLLPSLPHSLYLRTPGYEGQCGCQHLQGGFKPGDRQEKH